MSVFYRLHQDQSVGTKRSGKWYARAVPMATIDTRKGHQASSFFLRLEDSWHSFLLIYLAFRSFFRTFAPRNNK